VVADQCSSVAAVKRTASASCLQWLWTLRLTSSGIVSIGGAALGASLSGTAGSLDHERQAGEAGHSAIALNGGHVDLRFHSHFDRLERKLKHLKWMVAANFLLNLVNLMLISWLADVVGR
jgi:hypothetical protein